MSDEVCPECMGRCCRDDYGYPLAYLFCTWRNRIK